MQDNQRIDRARPTIGLLCRQVSDEIGAPLWAGTAHAAREHDANLFTFAGGSLRDPDGLRWMANTLFDLVGPDSVDGLIIWTGLLRHYVTTEEINEFCARYQALPRVGIEIAVPGVPTVLADFYTGMRSLVTHLIEAHGCRRIAFVKGPESAPTGQDRYRGYVDALQAHDIELDPALVVPGTFLPSAGGEGVRLLLDERKAKFEALACANDSMALNALEALQARGIRVPEDMLLTGFDDVTESRSAIPPLSTCRLPFFEMGCQAVDLLLAQMQGQPVPDQVSLQTPLMLRLSCGCPDPILARVWMEPARESHQAGVRREKLVNDMVQATQTLGEPIDPSSAGTLVDALLAELRAGVARAPDSTATRRGTGPFISTLDHMLRWAIMEGARVAPWHSAISALRRGIVPSVAEPALRTQVEDLLQQAQIWIGETSQRAETYSRIQAERQAGALRHAGQELSAARALGTLADALVHELPSLQIRTASVSLYRPSGAPGDALQLLAAYNHSGRLQIEETERVFPARRLVPEALWPAGRRYNAVVEALYSSEEHLGVAVLEVEPAQGAICDSLREQISSAITGALLTEKAQRRALQLQTAAQVSSTASTVLDPDELIRQSVDLVRSQFGLYYVGLFLLDADGRHAVLRAGTGDAGHQMVARGHKLEVDDSSMVGSCIAHRRARVALDVAQEKHRAPNPLLPDTRTELALPLLSRGAAIGALTVQSAQLAAFGPEDVPVLQTVADQLANAIANARLFEQSQRALVEMEAAQRRYLREAWQDLSETERSGPAALLPGGSLPSLDSAMADALRQGTTVATRDDPAGAALAIPLTLAGEVVGAVGAASDRPEGWNADEIAAAEAIVEQMALAVENQRLFDRAQRATALMSERVKALDFLNDVGRTTEATPPVPEFLAWVAGRIPAAMRHTEACVAAIEFEGRVYGGPDALKLPRQMVHRLVISGQPAGRMVVAYNQDLEFLDEESALLGDIARRVAGYIENRQLFDQVQAAFAEANKLYDASRRIASATDMNSIIAAAAEEARVPAVNRVILWDIERDAEGRPTAFVSLAGWYSGEGTAPLPHGVRFPLAMVPAARLMLTTDAILIDRVETDERLDPTMRALFLEQNARAVAMVPLWVGSHQVGSLMLVSEQPYHFAEADVRPYISLVGQLAVAIENRRLFEQTRQSLAETEALYQASAELTAADSYDKTLTTLRMHTLLANADRNVTIELFDRPWTADEVPEWTMAVARHSYLPVEIQTVRYPLRGSPVARLLGPERPTIVENTSTDPNLDDEARDLYEVRCGARSMITVPLVVGGQWIGIVEALFAEPTQFPQADVQRLVLLAGQAAVAIQSLRQFEQVQAALAEVEATHRRYLAGRWEAHMEKRETLAGAGYLYDAEYGPDNIPPVAGLWRPEMDGALQQVAPARAAEPGGGDSGGQRAGLAVPITLRGQPIGVLGVEDASGDAPREWSEDDVALLEEVSQQLGLALENARLFEETQRRAERERLITEITARIRASTDILGVIETTATELGRALGTSRTLVRLTAEDKE